MSRPARRSPQGRRRTLFPALAALCAAPALVVGACQDGLVDVGTTSEGELDDAEALELVVNGMGRTLSQGLGLVTQTGMFVALESNWGGNQGDFGATLSQAAGILDDVENDPHWNVTQQARWAAEDGVRRMREVLGEDAFASSPLAAEALLYVGFANRVLGENMCQGVVDGGPALPHTDHLERAEVAFTEALEIAGRVGVDDLEHAALAGRASVRVGLGDWDGAVADAVQVPQGFAWRVRHSATEVAQYNRIAWGTTTAFRVQTAHGSFYESYFLDTGDPRVAWEQDPANPLTQAGLPWLYQVKYEERSDPVELASYEEMRLVVAESLLRDGQVEEAMEEIDALRAAVGVDPWPDVDGLEDAWTALKRERGIELWLEGRRLGDLRRWEADGSPGESEDMSGRDLCFPIGATERGANPNID